MQSVQTRLEDHYNHAVKMYGEHRVFGVFLYGSQNYGLATPASDVDTKCIIMPTWEDMCNQEKWLSVELHVDGEHCEVKDIREMKHMWQKSNMNFLEILFTDYYLLNPKAEENSEIMQIWREILANANDIAYYDRYSMFMSIMGQTKGIMKAKKITGKKVIATMRMYSVMVNVMRNWNYRDIVHISNDAAIKGLKALRKVYEQKPQEELREIVETYYANMWDMYNKWIAQVPDEELDPTDIYTKVINKKIEDMIFTWHKYFKEVK